MAKKYCEPCTARGMTLEAFRWCTECEEALCTKCTDTHTAQKMSRCHPLVEIGKMPQQWNISINCPKHKQLLLEFFCAEHDIICCKECLPTHHRACKNVTSIDLASKNFKQSQSFLDFVQQLSFILEALEKLSNNCKENNIQIEQQESIIRNKITKRNESVLKHVESVEMSLLKQITDLTNTGTPDMKQQENEIGGVAKTTKIQKEAWEFVRDHGSEKQKFVSIHLSKPILKEIENKIKQLTESIVDISFRFIDSAVKEKVRDLGSIELKKTPCSFLFVPFKQHRSQVPIYRERQLAYFTHLYDIELKGEVLKEVTGITVSDNNTLIFSDVDTNKIYFCDKNDNYLSSISVPYAPWDIAAIPGTSTVVMSSAGYPYIQFLDIEKRRISQKVEVRQSQHCGIAATKHNIFVAFTGLILVFDLNGNFIRTISLPHSKKIISYISVCSNGNICYSTDVGVQCITSEGQHVFFYASSALQEPRNTTTDDVGNIYVLGYGSYNIIKLSSSGKLIQMLLRETLRLPCSFCFNKNLSKCYISNRRGKAISVFKTN